MALTDDIRAGVRPRRGGRRGTCASSRTRSSPTPRTLPGRVAAGARPRARGERRGARRVLAAAQRDQLRLRLVPDAAQAGRAVGLPHGRGRAARAAGRGRRTSWPRSTPRGGRRDVRPGPRARADGPLRARTCASSASASATSTAAASSRSRAPATARPSGSPTTLATLADLARRLALRRRATVPFFKRAQIAAADLALAGLAPGRRPRPPDAVRRQPRPARAAARRRARVRRRPRRRASTPASCSSTTRPRRSRSAPARCTRSSCSSPPTAPTTATAVDNVLWNRGAAPRYKARPAPPRAHDRLLSAEAAPEGAERPRSAQRPSPRANAAPVDQP